jgi:hypothetical protein
MRSSSVLCDNAEGALVREYVSSPGRPARLEL